MLFRKKEEKTNTVTNPVFGPLLNFKNWFTDDSYTVSLWGREQEAVLFMVADGPEDPVTPVQEETGRLFFEQQEMFQDRIEKLTEELLDGLSREDLKEINISGIYFSKNGEIGVMLDAEQCDAAAELEETGPEDTFGFQIHPETKYFSSNEDFLSYFY